jgi:hypothetical protein
MVLFRRLLGDVLRERRMQRGQKEASSELLASLCSALDVPLSDILRDVSSAVAVEEAALAPIPITASKVAARRGAGEVVASAA